MSAVLALPYCLPARAAFTQATFTCRPRVRDVTMRMLPVRMEQGATEGDKNRLARDKLRVVLNRVLDDPSVLRTSKCGKLTKSTLIKVLIAVGEDVLPSEGEFTSAEFAALLRDVTIPVFETDVSVDLSWWQIALIGVAIILLPFGV